MDRRLNAFHIISMAKHLGSKLNDIYLILMGNYIIMKQVSQFMKSQHSKQIKGICHIQNLYMYYFYNGVHFVMYLTNGVNYTILFLPNHSFYETHIGQMSKYVIQLNFNQKYCLMQEIGEGTFSKVYLGINRQTKQSYAIKVMPKSDETGFKTHQIATEEKKILGYLNTPLVSKMQQFFQDNENYIFVLQLITGKDLSKILKENKQLSVRQNIHILKQILRCLQQIHKHNIIHRDLKPHNIIIDDNLKVIKLVDFGLSLINQPNLNIKKYMRCGTMGYIAPQVVNNTQANKKPYDCKSDMFGFGIIAHMLLMNSNPIRARTYKETVQNNIKCCMKLDQEQIINKYGKGGLQFLLKLLEKDPKLRLNSIEALKSQFLEQKYHQQLQINAKKISIQKQVCKNKMEQINYIEDKQLVGNLGSSKSINEITELTSPKKTASSWYSSHKNSILSGIF